MYSVNDVQLLSFNEYWLIKEWINNHIFLQHIKLSVMWGITYFYLLTIFYINVKKYLICWLCYGINWYHWTYNKNLLRCNLSHIFQNLITGMRVFPSCETSLWLSAHLPHRVSPLRIHGVTPLDWSTFALKVSFVANMHSNIHTVLQIDTVWNVLVRFNLCIAN